MAYTATATTKGGRDGRAVLQDGKLALAMALPKDMGGSGEGHNPEQLFALGLVVVLRSGGAAARQEARPRRPGREGHLRHHHRQGRNELRAAGRH